VLEQQVETGESKGHVAGIDEVRKFHTWWRSLKSAPQPLPPVERFEPFTLPKFADTMFLVQREPAGGYQIRYMGEALQRLAVRPLSSGDYLELFEEDQAELLAQHFNFITGRRCGGYMKRRVERVDGMIVEAAHFGLPLMSGDGLVHHMCGIATILGCTPSGKKRKTARNEIVEEAYLDLGHGVPVGTVEFGL
jgi:hypothetical protein